MIISGEAIARLDAELGRIRDDRFNAERTARRKAAEHLVGFHEIDPALLLEALVAEAVARPWRSVTAAQQLDDVGVHAAALRVRETVLEYLMRDERPELGPLGQPRAWATRLGWRTFLRDTESAVRPEQER